MRQIYYRVSLFLGIYKREDFVTAHEVVKYAIVHYPVHPKHWIGICIMLARALQVVAKIERAHYTEAHCYIKALNKKFFGLPNDKNQMYDYWWETKGNEAKNVRIKALKKMLEYYSEHEVLIKKGHVLS